MSLGRLVSCVLCLSSEETQTTGALSIKDEVAAHQNCLLFSSGIFCRNSPQFDDLFGFSIEDVVKEVKRGRKLQCHKCKKKGATAGCEVKRCKRSYHFPCAVKKGAKVIEDPAKGSYGLYCSQHQPLQNTQSNGVVNRLNSDPSEPGTSNNHSGAGSTKVHCLTCEKKEGNLGPDSLSNAIVMCSCDKHAPSSYKRNGNNGSMAARLIVFTSDSDSSRSPTHSPVKRRLNRNTLEESPSKRKTKGRTFRTDEDSLNSESAIFAPLESDIDESANSVLEQQVEMTVPHSLPQWEKTRRMKTAGETQMKMNPP
ncbi:uncharacterized protein phf11 isoform X8 [Paralichthys olivaceus]|uniref:uncharacterized protein phf11 isoform X8 n=1 Tax=Paralichthys olivaceus TaxID=8255 RepID=UPI0037505377